MMISPQKESGYTPINNELLEVIYSAPFTATQVKILLAVCRYTYGFGRNSHALSESFISQAVNVSSRHMRNELNKLISLNVIIVVGKHTNISSRVLSINKNLNEWRMDVESLRRSSKPEVVKTPSGLAAQNPSGEVARIHQDNKNLNKNINKELFLFFEAIWERYPNKKGKGSVSDRQKEKLFQIGLAEINRCIERYVKTKEEWRAWKDGSTFFNTGYVDYLDVNFQEKAVSGTHIPYRSVRSQLFGEDA